MVICVFKANYINLKSIYILSQTLALMLFSHAQAQEFEKPNDLKKKSENEGEESGEDDVEDSNEDDSLEDTDEPIEHSSEGTDDLDSTAELAKEFTDVWW